MVGAIITLSIIAFVAVCALAVVIFLYRASIRHAEVERTIYERNQHYMERNTEATESLADKLNNVINTLRR